MSFFEALSIKEILCLCSLSSIEEDHLNLRLFSSSLPLLLPGSTKLSMGSNSQDKTEKGGKENNNIDVIIEHC